TAYASVADSIVGTTGTRRVFAYWSGDASGTKTTSNAITMDGPKTANANWTTQHYLTVNSAYSTPSGEGWYDENTDAYASVADSIVDGTPGTRYVFAGWSGDASGTNLTSDPITMDEPKTANADWTTQHYLTVISEYGTTAGEDWYDENTDAYAEVSPLSVPGNADTTFVFAGWTGDATGSTSPSDPIYMDGPKTAIATWDTTTATQVYLTLVTNPLDLTTLTGEGWYDLDSFAPISAPAYVDSSLYRWFFAGWTTDDMTEISDPYSTSTTVLMDMSKTVTANYQKMTRGTNGKSIGFWSAKNGGQPILTLDDAKYVYFLEPYIYGPKYPKERNNARPFDTLNLNTFKRQVNNFLLDANAVDMRYMLAAQLLATILNVRHGYLDVLQEVWVDDGDMVYEPNENWTIGAIIDSALARWSLGSGLSGSPYRATQEHIKNVLDKLNNNQLWYLVTTISTMTVTPQPQTNFSAMSNNSLTTLMPSITVAPNPFTRVATIRYTISISGNVSLNLYDATGRLVRILNDGYLNAGTYTTNLTGMNLAKGIYFLRFKTENYQNKIKVVIQ
ncbi:MAG: T9SS type A sorting domain-containing protein, partial [candidate division WOR-3 bacterium]